MVSGGYQLCPQAGEIHIFIRIPAVDSDEIKIEAKFFASMRFIHAARDGKGLAKKKNGGVSPAA